MKTFFVLSLLLLAGLLPADEPKREIVEGAKWPELVLRDGRILKDVTFLKVLPSTMKIMHAGGVLVVQNGKDLPYDVTWSATHEVAMAETREQEKKDLMAYEQKVTKEALEFQKTTGYYLEDLKDAIRCRDWCIENPTGGIFPSDKGPLTFTKIERDAMLKEVMSKLTTPRVEALREYEAQVLAEASELQRKTGRPLTLLQGLIRARDWCLANPTGGVFQAADGPHVFDKAKRDEQLHRVQNILVK